MEHAEQPEVHEAAYAISGAELWQVLDSCVGISRYP
jgi:hypothetical protein